MKTKQANPGLDYSERYDYPPVGTVVSYAFNGHLETLSIVLAPSMKMGLSALSELVPCSLWPACYFLVI